MTELHKGEYITTHQGAKQYQNTLTDINNDSMTEHEYNWKDFDAMQERRWKTERAVGIAMVIGVILLAAAGYWIFFCT